MKKLLLFSALGAMALAAQADDFSQYFKVTVEGKEVVDGGVIEVSEYTYDPEWDETEMKAIDMVVENLEGEARPIYGALYYQNPTQAEFKSNRNKWGSVQICFINAYETAGNCLSSFVEGCVGETTINIPPAGTANPFEWQIHRADMADPATLSEFTLMMKALDGDAKGDTEEIEDAVFTCTIRYSSELSSVKSISANSGVAEYYSLDGRRLSEPAGLCIEKKDGKVTKRVVR